MSNLSDKVKERMRQHAQSAQQSMQGGGNRMLIYNLTGKNAIVKPGESVLGRCLPRWDIAQKYVRGVGGDWELNLEYVEDLIYFVALEHWWDDANGKPSQEYCPRTFDEGARCPLCEASEDLLRSGSSEDRAIGKRIAARKSYLYNFVLGKTGKRALNEKGKPDIRVLPASNTIFVAISGFMTGGVSSDEDARAAFARGDISDPADGYDLMLSRPNGNQGERWKVDCAPQPTPLVTPAERAAWSDWMSLLIDIPTEVEKSIKSYEALYEAYWGQPPSADDAGADSAPTGFGSDAGGPATSAASNAPPAAPDPWDAHVPAAAPPSAPPFDPPKAQSAPKAAAPPRRPSGRR